MAVSSCNLNVRVLSVEFEMHQHPEQALGFQLLAGLELAAGLL